MVLLLILQDGLPPFGVVGVPQHGLAQGGLEVGFGTPAQRAEFGIVQRVAAVVRGTVFHELNQALRLAKRVQD